VPGFTTIIDIGIRYLLIICYIHVICIEDIKIVSSTFVLGKNKNSRFLTIGHQKYSTSVLTVFTDVYYLIYRWSLVNVVSVPLATEVHEIGMR